MTRSRWSAISCSTDRVCRSPPISRPRDWSASFERRARDGARETHGRLVIAEGEPRPVASGRQTSGSIRCGSPVASIGDAAKKLRALQNVATGRSMRMPITRRAALHRGQPWPAYRSAARPLRFGAPAPAAPLGSWTLLDPGTVLAAPRCSSPFANGEAMFVEDRHAPPSRAYLKLWELFTLIGERPAPGALCLDLGSSPGGWSWVLAWARASSASTRRRSIPPSPRSRASSIAATAPSRSIPPRSARSTGCSRTWCAIPGGCWGWSRNFLPALRTCWRFVCTLKFQRMALTDHATARRFAAIAGSRLLHLHHNKHELTWIKLARSVAAVGLGRGGVRVSRRLAAGSCGAVRRPWIFRRSASSFAALAAARRTWIGCRCARRSRAPALRTMVRPELAARGVHAQLGQGDEKRHGLPVLAFGHHRIHWARRRQLLAILTHALDVEGERLRGQRARLVDGDARGDAARKIGEGDAVIAVGVLVDEGDVGATTW